MALVFGFAANRDGRAIDLGTESATSWEAVIQDPVRDEFGRNRVNQFRGRVDGDHKFRRWGRFGRDAVIVQVAPNPISPVAP